MDKTPEAEAAVDDELERLMRATPFFETLDELAAYRAARAMEVA